MMVEGQPVAERWGRRLMATNPDNETLEKNCSEPGKQRRRWDGGYEFVVGTLTAKPKVTTDGSDGNG